VCIEDSDDDHFVVCSRRSFLAIEDDNAKLRKENAELLDNIQTMLMLVHRLWPLRRFVSVSDPIREIPIDLTPRGIVYYPKREVSR
jgi:hypothetical protein